MEPPCRETITRCSFGKIVLSRVTGIGRNPPKHRSTFFFSLSSLLLSISSPQYEIPKMRNVSAAVISFIFYLSLSFMLARRPQTLRFLRLPLYTAWRARATRLKQNSLITLQTLMQHCRAAGPRQGSPGLPTVSHMSSPVKLVDD